MYLRRLSIFIIIILSCLSLGSLGQSHEEEDNRRLKKIKSSLEKYNSKYPHQKVYLHLNKPSYNAGENIWFKAYVVGAADNRPDTLSTNLYLELINSRKEIIEMKRIRLLDGFGHGDFILRDTFPEGLYQLRSYTNWMRNFGNDYYFIHNFPFHKELGFHPVWNEIGVKGKPLHPPDMICMEMGNIYCINLFTKIIVFNIAFA